jgi:uncharacterized RDD family membrane protein YckC
MTSPAPLPPSNPYEAPQAAPAPPSAATQNARRINLINRRTIALLLENAAFAVTAQPLLSALLSKTGQPALSSGAVGAVLVSLVFFVSRDILGPESFGKRLLGLRIVRHDGSPEPPSVEQRIRRNLLFVFPVMLLVEFFVAYYDVPAMRRLGDRVAGLQVVDAAPERADTRTFNAALVGAVALAVFAGMYLAPRLTAFYAGLL